LEAVLHAKGSKFGDLSLENAGKLLASDKGHGWMFEQLVADHKTSSGFRVKFTKAGNLGTDLTAWDGYKMSFIQAKAWDTAASSAKEAVLDGLVFAGGRGRPGW